MLCARLAREYGDWVLVGRIHLLRPARQNGGRLSCRQDSDWVLDAGAAFGGLRSGRLTPPAPRSKRERLRNAFRVALLGRATDVLRLLSRKQARWAFSPPAPKCSPPQRPTIAREAKKCDGWALSPSLQATCVWGDALFSPCPQRSCRAWYWSQR